MKNTPYTIVSTESTCFIPRLDVRHKIGDCERNINGPENSTHFKMGIQLDFSGLNPTSK